MIQTGFAAADFLAPTAEFWLSMLVTWSPQDNSPERKLTSIAVSPATASGSGEYLLLATVTGDLQVWDLRQPERCELISQGSAHSEEVTRASWSRPVRPMGPTPIGAHDPAQMPQLTHRSWSTWAHNPSRPSVRSCIEMASYGQSM